MHRYEYLIPVNHVVWDQLLPQSNLTYSSVLIVDCTDKSVLSTYMYLELSANLSQKSIKSWEEICTNIKKLSEKNSSPILVIRTDDAMRIFMVCSRFWVARNVFCIAHNPLCDIQAIIRNLLESDHVRRHCPTQRLRNFKSQLPTYIYLHNPYILYLLFHNRAHSIQNHSKCELFY